MSVDREHRDSSTEVVVESAGSTYGPALRRALAVMRIAFGFTFLWAFLDKTFALGFSTGKDPEGVVDRFGPAAWINGGSPTEGFLTFGVPEDNPFKDFFNSMAGQTWADWLFMLGLLGVGVALILGAGMRLGTAAGAVLYAAMYVAVLPLENNPIVDDHLIGVIAMFVLALGAAGTTWGLGRWWNSQEVVKKMPILR